MDGRANPLMDRKVVGVTLFGVVAMVAVVTSPTTTGCSWLAADRTPPAFVRFSVFFLYFLLCALVGRGVLTSCSECVEHAHF